MQIKNLSSLGWIWLSRFTNTWTSHSGSYYNIQHFFSPINLVWSYMYIYDNLNSVKSACRLCLYRVSKFHCALFWSFTDASYYGNRPQHPIQSHYKELATKYFQPHYVKKKKQSFTIVSLKDGSASNDLGVEKLLSRNNTQCTTKSKSATGFIWCQH